MITKECPACHKEFSFDDCYAARLVTCSWDCRLSLLRNGAPGRVTLECAGCKQAFTVVYKRRNQRYCDRSCASHHGWNLGLTVSTSAKLRETIDRATKTKADMVVAGLLTYRSIGRGCHHVSSKISGKKTFCRSSFEARYCRILDSDPSVSSYEFEPVSIPYSWEGGNRRYVPDFLVTLTNGTRKLVEVKPHRLLSLPKNQAKLSAARTWCDLNDVILSVVTESDL